MLFSHDTERALACIVDLVNSAPSSGPSGGSQEQLPDLDALRAVGDDLASGPVVAPRSGDR